MVLKAGFTVNTTVFRELSPASLEFFMEHGFVVLGEVFTSDELDVCATALERLRMMFASEMGLELSEYDARICQWRDLWMTEPEFDEILRDERLISAAKFFMRQSSIQLIHDHVIRKPHSSLNSTIPWHQDYPFWPVDTPDALSTWTSMEDVSQDGGCLEVVDGSHKWGVSPPVDFIMDPMDFSNRDDVVRIPVRKGMMVVLHSLTWHRTNSNLDENTNRPAHISLWVPGFARYRPDLSDWHPVNDHITVEPGEHLNVDMFPRFGEFDESTVPSETNEFLHSGPVKSENSMDMFGATPRIAAHIHRILGESESRAEIRKLTDYVEDQEVRALVFQKSLEAGILTEEQQPWLEDVFDKMLINSKAFAQHRARNVYNDAYAQWWFHLGVKWVELWGEPQ